MKYYLNKISVPSGTFVRLDLVTRLKVYLEYVYRHYFYKVYRVKNIGSYLAGRIGHSFAWVNGLEDVV